jgi:hypothetical protein
MHYWAFVVRHLLISFLEFKNAVSVNAIICLKDTIAYFKLDVKQVFSILLIGFTYQI